MSKSDGALFRINEADVERSISVSQPHGRTESHKVIFKQANLRMGSFSGADLGKSLFLQNHKK